MIVCTGSIALDTTRTPFQTIEKALGGAGSFFSYCSSFFAPTKLVGVVGTDFPKTYRDLLEKKGVDLSGVKTSGKTMFIDWNYDYELYGRKTNVLELNALADFKPDVPKTWRKSPFVYLGTVPPEQQIALLGQMESPTFALLDTIEFYIQTQKAEVAKAFSQVDGVLINEGEARLYAGTPNLFKAARKILDEGPSVVVIKKGEHGALVFAEGTVFPSPAFPLEEVVDPTGAGDSFAGGFLGHIARTGSVKMETLKQAAGFGHVMGSFAVEDFGLKRLLEVTDEKIKERFNHYKQLVLWK